MMLKAVSNREGQGSWNLEAIENFPCEDLCIIDELWVRYSDRRFGFSVQKRIWQAESNENWEKFSIAVGWLEKNGRWSGGYVYNTSAPEGHLPYGPWREGYIMPGEGWGFHSMWGHAINVPDNGFACLATRLGDCNIQ